MWRTKSGLRGGGVVCIYKWVDFGWSHMSMHMDVMTLFGGHLSLSVSVGCVHVPPSVCDSEDGVYLSARVCVLCACYTCVHLCVCLSGRALSFQFLPFWVGTSACLSFQDVCPPKALQLFFKNNGSFLSPDPNHGAT